MQVKIYNRMDGGGRYSYRLSGARVYIINGNNKKLLFTLPNMKGKSSYWYKCSGKSGTRVMIQIHGSGKVLSLAEVQVWGKAGGNGNGG